MAMHAIALLVQQRSALETTVRQYPVPVRLIPSPCLVTVTPTDLSPTAELSNRANKGTGQ